MVGAWVEPGLGLTSHWVYNLYNEWKAVKVREVDFFLVPFVSFPTFNWRMRVSLLQTIVRFGVAPPKRPIQKEAR